MAILRNRRVSALLRRCAGHKPDSEARNGYHTGLRRGVGKPQPRSSRTFGCKRNARRRKPTSRGSASSLERMMVSASRRSRVIQSWCLASPILLCGAAWTLWNAKPGSALSATSTTHPTATPVRSRCRSGRCRGSRSRISRHQRRHTIRYRGSHTPQRAYLRSLFQIMGTSSSTEVARHPLPVHHTLSASRDAYCSQG